MKAQVILIKVITIVLSISIISQAQDSSDVAIDSTSSSILDTEKFPKRYFSLHYSMGRPLGDFKHNVKSGNGINLDVEVFFYRHVTMFFSVGYMKWSGDALYPVDHSNLTGLVGLKQRFKHEKFGLVIGAGLGASSLFKKSESQFYPVSNRSYPFTNNLLAGIEYRVNKDTNLYLSYEVQFLSDFRENSGRSIHFHKINLGFSFFSFED